MKKITVEICLGTTCFVMGASQLQNLVDILPKKYGERVSVTGKTCLDLCSSNGKYSKAPYVKIDDEVISDATVEKVMNVVNRKLKENEDK